MRRSISIVAAGLAGVALATLVDVQQWVSAQQRQSAPAPLIGKPIRSAW